MEAFVYTCYYQTLGSNQCITNYNGEKNKEMNKMSSMLLGYPAW